MFDTEGVPPPFPLTSAGPVRPHRPADRPDPSGWERLGALGQLGDRIRPVSSAQERCLPVPEVLAPLLPHGGLMRGTLVVTAGPAASSLALSLLAPTSTSGGWVAVVGLPRLGLVAAAELGVDLSRVLLIEEPDHGTWPTVVDALLDAMEIVVVRPPVPVGAGVQRRLMARARDRGSVLLQAGGRPERWAQAPDLVIDSTGATWSGLGSGHGLLDQRRLTVVVTGRRGADRPRRAEVLLPDSEGRLAAVPGAGTDGSGVVRPLREVG